MITPNKNNNFTGFYVDIILRKKNPPLNPNYKPSLVQNFKITRFTNRAQKSN